MDLDLLFLKRTPPHSLDAERTVLGGILVQNEALSTVLSLITPEDFYKDGHRRILERMIALLDKGVPVDPLSLADDLQKAGQLEEAGGVSYIASLLDGVPRNTNVDYYARIIKEKALLRKLILSSARIITDSYEEKDGADELLESAQTSFVELAEQRIKPGFLSLAQIAGPTMSMIKGYIDRGQAVTGVPTGFRMLDQYTAGLHGGELIILAARPSMGKTALALNIAQNVGLKTDYTVGFFSMEMAKEQLLVRLLCAEAQLDIKNTRTGRIGQRDFQRLQLAAEALSQARIYIDESAGLSVMEMKAKCRRLKMEKALDVVFIDYIQLMRTTGRFENRNQEMSYISRSLKELAKELSLPVVGISQLSRAPEKMRRDPRPVLSDLRESGALEQDADVVLFIYRPEYYDRDNPELKGVAEVSVAKQRNGPTGDVKLAFIREYARFADMEFVAPEP